MDGERPCPWVSCKWHLYADVDPMTGDLKLNFPDVEVHELEETCALDVAADGNHTCDEVGELLNLRGERVRQIERRALVQAKPEVRERLQLRMDGSDE